MTHCTEKLAKLADPVLVAKVEALEAEGWFWTADESAAGVYGLVAREGSLKAAVVLYADQDDFEHDTEITGL